MITGCGLAGGEATIAGEIHDDRIDLEAASGPQMVWLELTHVGTAPCELIAILSETPEDVAVSNGSVTPDQGLGYQNPMAAYVEADGQQVGAEGGPAPVIEPGSTARMQIALTSAPEGAVRVILCNGSGEYEAGRYAILAFDR